MVAGFLHSAQLSAQNPGKSRAQFFYMWDDEALYIGLRCLDKVQANSAPLERTYDGDAVEFYLDTRPGDSLRGKDWTTGAIHFYYSPSKGPRSSRVGPFGEDCDQQRRTKGVEVAASE